MKPERLRHDVAIACTQNSFDFLRGLLRAEVEQEVFEGLYARILAALEIYDLKDNRWRRHRPGKN